MLVRKPTRPKFTPSAGTSGAEIALQRPQHRAVAAEHDRQVGLARAGGLDAAAPRPPATAVPRRRRSRRACRAPSRRCAPPPRAQALATASAIARSTSTSRSSAAGCPAAATYTTYSWFPAGPGRQESHTPRTAAPAGGDKSAELPQHPPAHLRVADDAAADVAAAGLELRLHQHERAPERLGARDRGRQHQPQRDERDVGRDQRRRIRQRPRLEPARVRRPPSPSPARRRGGARGAGFGRRPGRPRARRRAAAGSR